MRVRRYHCSKPLTIYFLSRQHPKKNKKGKGEIRVEHAEVHKQATLLEYLAGGLQISMTCAIDFTGECDGLGEHDTAMWCGSRKRRMFCGNQHGKRPRSPKTLG